MRYSVRLKLFAAFILICFVPLAFLTAAVRRSTEEYFRKERELKLLTSANIIAGNIARAGYLTDESKRPLFDTELDVKGKEGGVRIVVVDTKGLVVNDTGKSELGKTYATPEITGALTGSSKVTLRTKEMMIYATVSIMGGDSSPIGAVLLAQSAQDVYQALGRIDNTLLMLVITTLVFVSILSFMGSRLLLDPLKIVSEGVKRMSRGHLSERITVRGRDEFSELAEAFNNMSHTLEHIEGSRSEFVSNVSHELKTPLSSIKVLTEAVLLEENAPLEMYREFLSDINAEVDRMTNIVNDLLNLVKLDQGERGLNLKKVSVLALVVDILKRLYPLAELKNIELLLEEIEDTVIEADAMKISLALTNLIENGIKYTEAEGTVKVTIDSDHQNAFITVADTGIGIDEEEQKKVFDRFYRVDKTRDRETGGTGLGLSITLSTVLLHNGSIKLTSAAGKGTTFVVRLPVTVKA